MEKTSRKLRNSLVLLSICSLFPLVACSRSSAGDGDGDGDSGDGDIGDGDGDGAGGGDGDGDDAGGGDGDAAGGSDGSGGADGSGGSDGGGGDAFGGMAGGDGSGGSAPDLCESVTCGTNQTCNSDTGNCECDAGFTGTDCDECAVGFEGASCDTCASGFFGANCDECPACVQGTCDDSMSGSGVCECDTGFGGGLCDACDVGYVDDAGSCDACAPGFEDTGSGSALCLDCSDGYYGTDCSFVCPACVNGTCDQGVAGTGVCECSGNFAGDLCDTCAPGYSGASCNVCDDGYQDFDHDGVCEPDCGGGICDGFDLAHGLTTGVHDVVLRSGTTPLYIDSDYQGGGWILVGRGREGWNWSEDGDSSLDWASIKDGLGTAAAFEPRFLAQGLIQGLIDHTLGDVDVADVEMRLKRAAEPFGTEYQETHLWYVNRSDFSWLLDTASDSYLVSGYFAESYLGTGGEFENTRFRDIQVANDQRRVFTYAWGSHDNQKGFSFGNSIDGVNNDNPNSFLWEYTSEAHSIPYTEVYVRIPGCDSDGIYCGTNADSCDDSAGAAVCDCSEGYTGKRCDECDLGYQDNDGDGVCEVGCDLFSCSVDGEACADDSGSAICMTPAGEDCLDILTNDASAADGTYYIYPPGAPRASEVYCDMTTDGGGYTFFKIATDDLQVKAPDAEIACAERGMQLFIPRTEAHLVSAYAVATDVGFGPSAHKNYLRIMGVYPSFNGATCNNMELNSSNASCQWVASDAGPFWISDVTNRNEPNGDNNVLQSMYYDFNTSGVVTAYNDAPAGYGSAYFMCDTGTFQGL